MHQRAAQAQLLLHAARQLVHRPVGEGRQTGGFQQGGDAAVALGMVMAEQAGEEGDILRHREIGVEIAAQALRHIGDARLHGFARAAAGEIDAQRRDAALLQLLGAGGQRQQGGFADPIGPDQSQRRARRQVEAHILQRDGLAVTMADMGDAQTAMRCPGIHCVAWVATFAVRSDSSQAGQAAAASSRT